MTFRKWAERFVLFAGGVVLALVLVAFLAVQIQQRTLRWHAERLMADMHQIRLYQSTWADAQRLMHRWGTWGYYDGSCTAASCKYEIELDSHDRYNSRVPRSASLDWFLKHDRLNLYQWFGGRLSVFHASFTVHNGTIWRESTWIGVSVPRKKKRRVTTVDTILNSDDFDWTLSVGAGSHQRLNPTREDTFRFTGGDESLAGHPYYKVGRPSGCKVLCEIVSVYYSTRTPPAEIERLTSYDFSCFTRFNPCARIVDLLPAAEEWHLYDSEYESSPTVLVPKERPLFEYFMPKPPPCSSISVWAQARDAGYVLAVEAVSTKTVKVQEDYGEFHHEVAKVRIASSLKETAPWLPGAIVSTNELYWEIDSLPSSEAVPLIPGRRYIVFLNLDDSKLELVTKDTPLSFGRCGVREDTPEVRRELEKGFAQNDTLHP